MQHSNERPQSPARPSLLSAEQQAEAGNPGILGGLDGQSGRVAAGAGKRRRGSVKWLASGAAVLAIGAASMFWLSAEGEKEIVLAGTAPVPPMAAPPAQEVSTAAILEDAPVLAPAAAAVVAAKPDEDELRKFLSSKAPAKVAPQRMLAKAHRLPAPPRKKPVAHPKAVPPQDTDVALLAALVAHAKATQPTRPAGAAARLQQCKTLGSVAEAEQCRARLCAGHASKEDACKAQHLAKAVSGS
ncbi:MAG: hypothetical protein V4484_14140 [Pseudomonadota bacterium]